MPLSEMKKSFETWFLKMLHFELMPSFADSSVYHLLVAKHDHQIICR